MALDDVVGTFARASFRWWVAGGHALELHVGESWRTHADIDVGIVRMDADALRDHLAGWDIQIAAAGELSAWTGGVLTAAKSQNNLWCRREAGGPWELDLLVGEGTADEWIYKRDPELRRSWSDVILGSEDGVPYLAPEVQLLFKSKGQRPKDDVDAQLVIPRLSEDRRAWLMAHLPDGHDWRE